MDKRLVDEVNDIAKKMGGRLTADAVIAKAKNRKTALHAYFKSQGCYDPNKSMHQWSLQVARDLIRSIKVVVVNETMTYAVPAYIRDPQARASNTQGYSSLSRLRLDEDLAREAVIHEFNQAAACFARARRIAKALGSEEQIEELETRMESLLELFQSGGTPS